MDAVLRICVFLFVLACTTATDPKRIIFPIIVTLEEGDVCSLDTGVTGRCTDIRNCDYTKADLHNNPPVRCGFNGIYPIVCCSDEKGHHQVPQYTTDVSQPLITFQCGRNYEWSRFFGELIDETDVVAFPWTVIVGEIQGGGAVNWFCDGVLINEEWVLSPANCLTSNKPEVVRIGDDNFLDGYTTHQQDLSVAESYVYPGYTHTEGYHNLALIKLSARVPFGDQRSTSPVCLPWGDDTHTDITGLNVTHTGFGNTDFDGNTTPFIDKADVAVISSTQCDAIYSTFPHYTQTWQNGIGQETLCAWDSNVNLRSCEISSGGSLVTQTADGFFLLAGIASSQSHSECNQNYPSVYTNLRHQPYLTWIKKIAFTPY